MEIVKKIIVFLILLCISTKASAQIPEIGMSREKVYAFMKGKYKYTFLDTSRISDDPVKNFIVNSAFAPVLFYGVEGKLILEFDDSDRVSDIFWMRGTTAKDSRLRLLDTALSALLESRASIPQILKLELALRKEKGITETGKPVERGDKELKDHTISGPGFLLLVKPDQVTYFGVKTK